LDRLTAQRIILAQRVPDPIRGQHNAPQFRVPPVLDAKEIVGFALVPVGRGPDAAHAVDHGWLARQGDLEAQSLSMLQGVELVDAHKARRQAQVPLVDGAHKETEGVGQFGIVAQKLADRHQVLGMDGDCRLSSELTHVQDRLWEALFQFLHTRIAFGHFSPQPET
jgi:hypothetical protein